MSPSAGWRLAAAAALAAALAAPAGAQELAYTRRLELPVVGEAIGYARGVTADLHTGEVFVCDTRGNRILIFDDEGLFSYEVTGGDTFTAPRDVAVDPEGYLVAIANHQTRRSLIELDFDGAFLGRIPLSGLPDGTQEPHLVSVALSPSGDRIYALDATNLQMWILSREGLLIRPVDLAPGLTEKERFDVILGHVDVYGDRVLIAIASMARIWSFDLDGDDRRETGLRGTAPCMIAFPVAAALMENGEYVIVDQQRMVVLRWDPVANRCRGESLGLGAAPGFLYYPMDLALDGAGRIYISQGYDGRVQMYEGMLPPPR